jgi:hypothetical protein
MRKVVWADSGSSDFSSRSGQRDNNSSRFIIYLVWKQQNSDFAVIFCDRVAAISTAKAEKPSTITHIQYIITAGKFE